MEMRLGRERRAGKKSQEAKMARKNRFAEEINTGTANGEARRLRFARTGG